MPRQASKQSVEPVERKSRLINLRVENDIVLSRLAGRIQERTGVRSKVSDCIDLLIEDLRGKNNGITAELKQMLSEAPNPVASLALNPRKTKSV